ncbi:glycosyl transferase, group 2 family protein [Metarhizium album ARSEF 1941]|uniref:Glycosyl transferase, group 2 family protein n=1 Tax=Metarhizium album (strain ARSEF 1941) TaxID=1081103 RepID=A0A0B2X7R3_METAS|nr:glycosyl transferase, group 2 family protein [Metarhizium album ARSEF 1941]KHO01321.1 glycosyl transferase, group 2 family protein [Metarhizium album ARSEF 1941]
MSWPLAATESRESRPGLDASDDSGSCPRPPDAALLPLRKSQHSLPVLDTDSIPSPGASTSTAEEKVEKPSRAKHHPFRSYHPTSSISPKYMVQNIKHQTKALPLEQSTLDDAEFEALTRLMDDKQKRTVPGLKRKTAFRALYILVIAIIVYFALVGWPIWPGAVLSFWRWYEGAAGSQHISGLVAFLVAGMIRDVLPQFLSKFESPAEETTAHSDQGVSQTCVIISCYKSAETLRSTLPACLQIFRPNQVFVVANGNSSVPLDNTADVCSEFGVRHTWLPVGSKITAQFVGVMVGTEFEYCLLIDDDVLLPPNLPIPTHCFTGPGRESVACVGYTIKSVGSSSSRGTIIQQAQDLEYKLSGLSKVFQAKFGGAIFPHGAISLWRRDVLQQLLRGHPGYSISEDWWLGHTARAAGYSIMMSSSVFVETETPPRLFPYCLPRKRSSRSGYGEMSVVQQRFFRWNFFFLFRVWSNAMYVLFCWRLGWRMLIMKIYALGESYDTLLLLITPVFLPVALAANWRLTLTLWFGTIFAYFILCCWFNIVHLGLFRRKAPTDERVSWLALPPFLILKMLMIFVAVGSVYWSIYQYALFFTRQHLRVTESVPAWNVIREKNTKTTLEDPELGGIAPDHSEEKNLQAVCREAMGGESGNSDTESHKVERLKA